MATDPKATTTTKPVELKNYSIHNPTRAPRVIFDGKENKAIRIEPGATAVAKLTDVIANDLIERASKAGHDEELVVKPSAEAPAPKPAPAPAPPKPKPNAPAQH